MPRRGSACEWRHRGASRLPATASRAVLTPGGFAGQSRDSSRGTRGGCAARVRSGAPVCAVPAAPASAGATASPRKRRHQREVHFGTPNHDLVRLPAAAAMRGNGGSARKTLRDRTFPRRTWRTAVAARPLRRTLASEVRGNVRSQTAVRQRGVRGDRMTRIDRRPGTYPAITADGTSITYALPILKLPGLTAGTLLILRCDDGENVWVSIRP
jgi:hypothetical protein